MPLKVSPSKSPIQHFNQGFTMIELLVALAIVSIGMLGVAALQLVGVRGSNDTYIRSQGATYVNEIAERMHSNQVAIAAGDYVTNYAADFDCAVPDAICEREGNADPDSCSPAEMAAYDTFVVFCGRPNASGVRQGGIISTLPDPELVIQCVEAGCPRGSRYTMTLSWKARETDQDPNVDMDGDDDPEFQTKQINLNFLP